MKDALDPRRSTLAQAAGGGDEPPTGGATEPIPTPTVMPIPGGKPFEPPRGGGQDNEPPEATTTMPLKGR